MTDFGLADGALGTMKAVIKSINPSVELIDISHGIRPYNIREGAFVLLRAYSYFPAGTIFICVVDPGVGSSRRPILLSTDKYHFIAPDNGLLSYVSDNADNASLFHINNPDFQRPKVSPTFHGRDIFAPAAAYLSLGIANHQFGEQITHMTSFKTSPPKKITRHSIEAELLFTDNYGNGYTNIHEASFESVMTDGFYELCIENKPVTGLFKKATCYTDVEKDKELLYFGSSGYLELAIREASFIQSYPIRPGNRLTISKVL